MAKQSIETLLFLKEMADKEVEKSMQSLAEAMQALEAAQGQKTMLLGYQQEYQQQLENSAKQGMEMGMYRNFQAFYQQLETAVTGQDEQIRYAEGRVQMKKQDCILLQRKQKSYEVLIARAQQQEQKVALKREQKMTDEFASRAKRVQY